MNELIEAIRAVLEIWQNYPIRTLEWPIYQTPELHIPVAGIPRYWGPSA